MQPPKDCIMSCDADCENGSMHCADIHEVRWRQNHPGEECPGIHVCGIGPKYDCCHPDGRNRVIVVERPDSGI